MNLCPPDCPCLLHPCIIWWKPGFPCMAVRLCPSHFISVPTPCLECVHASVHVFMSTCLTMLAQPCMDSYMETWIPLCGSVCPSHTAYGTIPLLECVHASVHVFMSTWLPISPQTPMHSYMEKWVPLYGPVFVSQSPHFCSHTLLRICTCISTCIYVNHSSTFCSTPLDSYMESWVPLCSSVCVPVTLLLVIYLG